MSDADDDVSPVQTVAPPQSQAEWKLRIASASGKDLLKLVQRDKPRASRVLSGFRATEQAIKNPVVMSRVADEAMKQPGFASDLAASLPVYLPVPLPAREPIPSDSAVAVSENAANPSAGDLSDASPHPQPEQKKEAQLREQREKQRAALREQEDRIAV